MLLLALSGSKWAALAALALAGVVRLARRLGRRRRWSPTSSRRSGTRRPTRPCAWPRTSASWSGRRSAGSCSLLGSWPALFPTVAMLSAAAWVDRLPVPAASRRVLARRGRRSEVPSRVILADRPFLLFLGSAVFAWLVYVAYEIVLPVSLVDGFGYQPAAWGFLVWINPLLVTLFQLRLTRATAGVPAAPKLVVALLVMGLPYLLLVQSPDRSRARRGRRDLRDRRDAVGADVPGGRRRRSRPRTSVGAYMGAFGSAPAIGFALAPLIGLQVRNSFGDEATWTMFAVHRRGRRRPGRARARGRRGGARREPLCCTGGVRQEERELILREDAPRAQTARERRQLGGRRRGSPLEPAPRQAAAASPAQLPSRSPRATSRRSAGRCRTWCGCARSRR